MERFTSPRQATSPQSHRILAAALAVVITLIAFCPPAVAGDSDEKMLAITKTTVYGAILGGILGLTSSLVVDGDSRDDAIRWGVALGSLAGFAYGVIEVRDDGFDLSNATRTKDRGACEPMAMACAPRLEGIGIGLISSGEEIQRSPLRAAALSGSR